MRAFWTSFYSWRGAATLLALGLAGCVERYLPTVLSTPSAYLVVDGFINGNGVTRIKLSRSQNISATTTPPAEKGARVYIQDNTGRRYSLTEKSTGLYQSDSLLLPTGRQYQLLITTAGSTAANYASDPMPLKVTPPIDKLGWRANGTDVELLVSTHDPSAQARYYRWSFVETWEFNTAYESHLQYYPRPNPVYKEIDTRTTPIYTCWRTERPTNIAQATTAQLSQDALNDQVIRTMPARAERFKVRYSVLVGQYTETPEEFAYLELLRKNTEAVGTVNDPLPVQLTGNVHRVDNVSEPVLGFVGAHTMQYKRLFISRTDLPSRADSDFLTPYSGCQAGILYICDQHGKCDLPGIIALFNDPTNIPLDKVDDPVFGAGYSAVSADCADCRLRGSNVKPSFW